LIDLGPDVGVSLFALGELLARVKPDGQAHGGEVLFDIWL